MNSTGHTDQIIYEFPDDDHIFHHFIEPSQPNIYLRIMDDEDDIHCNTFYL